MKQFSLSRYSIYNRKRHWKILLLLFAIIIIAFSLFYSNLLVKKIAKDERMKIHTWANAIQTRARLVNSTQKFFAQIQEEERNKVQLYAEAQKRFVNAGQHNEDMDFYMKIIQNNNSIPVILTDSKGKIISTRNTVFSSDTVPGMEGYLKKEFSKYPRITIPYYKNEVNYIYYNDSKLFTEMQVVLNNLVNSFFSEVVNNSASVPVLVTDSMQTQALLYGQIDTLQIHNPVYLQHTIHNMAAQNDPIEINIAEQGKRLIFYKDSYVLTQLRYFPYIQLAIISIFLLVAYMLFSTARRSEQNQVWAGLAKETAHQLGTPLSSMMAWVDYLEAKDVDSETIEELRKDVNRLSTITDRFSKIGSNPSLVPENVVSVIYDSVSYLKTRTSQKITYSINVPPEQSIVVPLNLQLFEWVIENLVKNAVDAMTRQGSIKIEIMEEDHVVNIDIADTGKGIPRNMFRTIFNPGYTSKQRGWGLGLSLSKRIICEYHRGKIFVKSSTLGKGTTFRIVLNKSA
ncbi:MAG: HAMP domain-containing sensor histidine kinase [Bacteroidota bacterium]